MPHVHVGEVALKSPMTTIFFEMLTLSSDCSNKEVKFSTSLCVIEGGRKTQPRMMVDEHDVFLFLR